MSSSEAPFHSRLFPHLAIAAAGVLVLALALSACQSNPGGDTAAQTPSTEAAAVETAATRNADPVAHGKYLVSIMGCNDCHTPLKMGENGPEPDMDRFLSGHPQDLYMPPAPKLPEGPWQWSGAATLTAFSGPWGVTFAANLTPDTTTGIGAWTEDMFVRSIRSGRHWGTGREIQPPMPWQAYSNLSDGDIHAIYVYLRSLPPRVNEVPPYIPPGQVASGG